MRASPPLPAPSAPAVPPAGGARFSEELRRVLARCRDGPASLADLLEVTRGRGYDFALILVAAPFLGPIPLPGLSLPFGLVVALLGVRQLLDRTPWLPRSILERRIPPRVLAGVFGLAEKLMRLVEVLVRPRLAFFFRHPVFARLAGLLTAIAGGMLMLPLPLPLSNSLPAGTVVLLALGALGRDGVFFLAGCAAFLLSLAFFALVAWGGVAALAVLPWILRRPF